MGVTVHATYEIKRSLEEIAVIMQNSRKPEMGSKIVYVGSLPAGIAEVYYENSFSDELKIRFSEPVNFKRLEEIGRAERYKVVLLPKPPETKTYEVKVFDQNGKFVKTETREQTDHFNWFKLANHKDIAILEIGSANPETVEITKDLRLRWPGRGPVSNRDALKILEQYRREIYEQKYFL